MSDSNYEKNIKAIYEHQKYAYRKNAAVTLVVYLVMIGVFSLFLGNPFPHQTTILLLKIWQYGWISTRSYLLILCAVVALICSFTRSILSIWKDFKNLDEILLHHCDIVEYLKVMEKTLSYGKTLKFKGLQKNVFMLAQQRYSAALIANEEIEKCRKFLNEQWEGKKNSRLYKCCMLNLDFTDAYKQHDAKRFNQSVKKAGHSYKNNKILAAKGMMLQPDYETSEKMLKNYIPKTLYNNVQKQYLLGVCYIKMSDDDMAMECMEYVAENGGTTPCKVRAQKWISQHH